MANSASRHRSHAHPWIRYISIEIWLTTTWTMWATGCGWLPVRFQTVRHIRHDSLPGVESFRWRTFGCRWRLHANLVRKRFRWLQSYAGHSHGWWCSVRLRNGCLPHSWTVFFPLVRQSSSCVCHPWSHGSRRKFWRSSRMFSRHHILGWQPHRPTWHWCILGTPATECHISPRFPVSGWWLAAGVQSVVLLSSLPIREHRWRHPWFGCQSRIAGSSPYRTTWWLCWLPYRKASHQYGGRWVDLFRYSHPWWSIVFRGHHPSPLRADVSLVRMGLQSHWRLHPRRVRPVRHVRSCVRPFGFPGLASTALPPFVLSCPTLPGRCPARCWHWWWMNPRWSPARSFFPRWRRGLRQPRIRQRLNPTLPFYALRHRWVRLCIGHAVYGQSKRLG